MAVAPPQPPAGGLILLWRGTQTTRWNTAGNWIDQATGLPPAHAPRTSNGVGIDNVIFDGLSPNCQIDANDAAAGVGRCNGFLATVLYAGTITLNAATLHVDGGGQMLGGAIVATGGASTIYLAGPFLYATAAMGGAAALAVIPNVTAGVLTLQRPTDTLTLTNVQVLASNGTAILRGDIAAGVGSTLAVEAAGVMTVDAIATGVNLTMTAGTTNFIRNSELGGNFTATGGTVNVCTSSVGLSGRATVQGDVSLTSVALKVGLQAAPATTTIGNVVTNPLGSITFYDPPVCSSAFVINGELTLDTVAVTLFADGNTAAESSRIVYLGNASIVSSTLTVLTLGGPPNSYGSLGVDFPAYTATVVSVLEGWHQHPVLLGSGNNSTIFGTFDSYTGTWLAASLNPDWEVFQSQENILLIGSRTLNPPAVIRIGV